MKSDLRFIKMNGIINKKFRNNIVNITMAASIIWAQSYQVQSEEFNYQKFSSQYSTLTTIAGKGDDGMKFHNNWRSEFDNNSALLAELSRPHHAISDSKGNIYIADKDAHAIRVIAPSGTISTYVGTNEYGFNGDQLPPQQTQLAFPNGIWITKDDSLYILDLANNRVRRVKTDGQVSTLFEDPDGLKSGRGLWVSDDHQQAYYANHDSLRLWQRGKGIAIVADGFVELGNIAVKPDGNILATDRFGHRVYLVTPDGQKTVVAGNGKRSGGGDGELAINTGLDQVRGIWLADNGGYFLATHAGGQIWFVDPNGIIHLFLDGGDLNQHSGDAQNYQSAGKKISEPRAISLDPKGNIIITENDLGFIRKITRKELNVE